ncbi:hypothetical protein DID88_010437 [Monilinia fructigena]|uniref:Uncharacterized protein n=1 Tax=Monilinia fructigena TaxID=38457 RepID=A0A395ILE7_9HELO|nr:hypothetical protein DID88_010437 [Monilinia fructigena]
MDQDNNGPDYGADGQPEEGSSNQASPALPPPAPVGPYRAIYPDSRSARAAKLSRVADAIEEANDRGVFDNAPNDPAHQRVYIRRLFNAFNSIDTEGDDSIIDKPCKNGKLSQAALKFQQGRYPAHAIEEVCWEIFEKAKVAQIDVRLLDIFHDAKFEGIAIHATFNHRWTAIVNACTRSKALCKMLLDAPYLERFVSHPQAELKINAQRDEQNEIGRTFLSKGLGKEEAAEALAKLHPDAENSFDEYALPGPRSSVDNVAGPVTPAAPVRIQPARATTSSVKRKKISDSDDEDYDDEYFDSAIKSSVQPSARTRRATLKTPTRSKTNHSVMDTTPQSKKLKVPTTVARQRRLNDLTPLKSQTEMDIDAEDRYRREICALSDIDRNNQIVRQYSLEDLRYYARAYNGEFGGSTWTHKDYPGWSGLGYTFTDENHVVYDHFCKVIKSFMPLAKFRGDFLNGNLDRAKNLMFQPRSSADREALGVTANTFGFHVGYPASVNIKSHGSPGMLAEKSEYSTPVGHMNAYQPYRQDYYQGQGSYDQSSLQYPSYSQNQTSTTYTPLPQSYGSTSRSYSQDSFPQTTLGSQQSFGSHSNYGTGFGYNSQPSGMYDTGHTYATRTNNLYSTTLRGASGRYTTPHTSQAGYTSGLVASSTDYHAPLIGQSPSMTSDHIMGGLSTTHHGATSSSQYPDPDECSNQPQQH